MSARPGRDAAAAALLPEGAGVGVHYHGLPWRYELGSLIDGVREAGRRESSLAPESLEHLAGLDGEQIGDDGATLIPACGSRQTRARSGWPRSPEYDLELLAMMRYDRWRQNYGHVLPVRQLREFHPLTEGLGA